jgi:hypothetical protein
MAIVLAQNAKANPSSSAARMLSSSRPERRGESASAKAVRKRFGKVACIGWPVLSST